MEKLENNLFKLDLEIFKKIRTNLLNKYTNYHRQLKFSTNKGLIAYTDSLLNKYATFVSTDTNIPNPAQRSILNISSIASSENDAYILASVILDFIANCEAAIVNGGAKFIMYSMIQLNNFSKVSSNIEINLAMIINQYLPASALDENARQAYFDVLEASKDVSSKYRADTLFSIISYIFTLTRKLLVYFSRLFSSDKRLSELNYKNSVASAQNQINYLLELFIKDFFSTYKALFLAIRNEYVNYSDVFNQTVYSLVIDNLPSVYLNNVYSLEDSIDKINKEFVTSVNNLPSTIIPDLSTFSDFLNTINEDYFLNNKSDLLKSVFSYFTGQ